MIANYYKNYDVPAGKSLTVIIATHAPMLYALPERLAKGNEGLEDEGGGYCSSF